jgi:hypothetical protein
MGAACLSPLLQYSRSVQTCWLEKWSGKQKRPARVAQRHLGNVRVAPGRALGIGLETFASFEIETGVGTHTCCAT